MHQTIKYCEFSVFLKYIPIEKSKVHENNFRDWGGGGNIAGEILAYILKYIT